MKSRKPKCTHHKHHIPNTHQSGSQHQVKKKNKNKINRKKKKCVCCFFSFHYTMRGQNQKRDFMVFLVYCTCSIHALQVVLFLTFSTKASLYALHCIYYTYLPTYEHQWRYVEYWVHNGSEIWWVEVLNLARGKCTS